MHGSFFFRQLEKLLTGSSALFLTLSGTLLFDTITV